MATQKIILCSATIALAWGVLYWHNNAENSNKRLTDTLQQAGIDTEMLKLPETVTSSLSSLESLKDLAVVPDIIERKTTALIASYERLAGSTDQMIDSIQQMKTAANSFQEGKKQMLNEFKDLPTDLLEANSFQAMKPVLNKIKEDASPETP
jgi:hypothetical protein